jgi:hypothetical protein
MLDFVEMKPVVDIHKLVDAIGEIDNANEHRVFDAIRYKCCYGGNESYLEISKSDILMAFFEHWIDTFRDIDINEFNANWKEYMKRVDINSIHEKVDYRLLEMIDTGDLPRTFVVRVWW